tara:strand:+ start:3716 stop:5287 length:1572 start_codon:yes stop_codon:yes gene_type:complete
MNFSNQFQLIADQFPDREALVNIERNRRYTFKEWHLLSNRIVNMMRDALYLAPGDCYINILDNDNMSLLHIPTVLKGPFVAAWTNYRDSLSEHAWQAEAASAKVAFIENDLLESHYQMLRDLDVSIVCMDPIEDFREGVHYFWDLVEGASDANPDVEIDDRLDPILIRFTGGTTGRGKPAVYCADNWLGLRDTFYALPDKAFNSSTRLLHLAPISHGSGMWFIPTFYAGGCNITQNQPDLGEYCRNIQNEKVTAAMLVPTILYRLLELPEATDNDLSTLQYIYYGASPMSPSKLKKLQEKFGNIFIQGYGSTEHFACALSLSTEDHIINSPEDETRLASAGRATPGVEILVMDDDGKPVRPGEVGELWLRSRGVCLGYLDNPEKTAEEFVNGYWKSGDMAYVDQQGFTYLVDRKKDLIISGGFNVYANEVESALHAHEAVFMSAVVGVPHEEWGEAVHAEVILQKGATIDERTLMAFVKDRLGSYKAPKSLRFVDELPLSPVGKVLRRKVRDKYWRGAGREVG